MIVNRQRAVRVALRPLDKFLCRVERELSLSAVALTICFVSDAEIARMNAMYRGKKGPTDVLSFPAGNARRLGPRKTKGTNAKAPSHARSAKKIVGRRERAGNPYLGDVVIAPETAQRYAKKNGRSLARELRVLILHGVLHLLGYDHETDRGQMNRLEQKLRRRFGLQ
ncbi:MAG TPA: rRNA maturation RNase YbeY [Candidatus Methylomirabilis sp.]|nr:rRNA maturation RNase YbeY [Candidatus Methylomirabilis sp.]